MGLKILHSADWHLDSPFAGFTQSQREYLKSELRKVPGKVAEVCIRENCDLVLLSGDLFDGPYSRDSARLAAEAMARCGVPVLIAPGNHDYLASGSPWLEEKWPDNVYIFTGGISSIVLKNLDCRIYGAGYRSAESPALLKDFKADGTERWQIALLHGDPMRLYSPYCPITAAQVRDSGLHYLALGHIHKSGSFRARSSLCGWPGCPMGRGFDETREKGVYIVEMEERATVRFEPLDTPRFYELEVDTDETTLAEVLPAVHDGNFYRITLTGSGEASARELAARYEGLPNLELIDHRKKPSDPWARAERDSLEGVYFGLLREKLANAPADEAECIRLAAQITQTILEGGEVVL